jgi:hypothetical protein
LSLDLVECFADGLVGEAFVSAVVKDGFGFDGSLIEFLAEPFPGSDLMVAGGGAFEGSLSGDLDGLVHPFDGRYLMWFGESDVARKGLHVIGEGISDGNEEAALGGIGVVDEGPDGASGTGGELCSQAVEDETTGVARGAVDGDDRDVVAGGKFGEGVDDGAGIVMGGRGSESE